MFGWRCLPRRGKGAVEVRGGAACLRQGRFGKRAPGLGGLLCWRQAKSLGAQVGLLLGAREVVGGVLCLRPFQAEIRFRRGYGGLCPHPLKGFIP